MPVPEHDLLRRIDELGRAADRRIALVEREQETHEREVEARLNRYEQTAADQTERIIEAVSGLAKLEAVPEQIRDLRREFKEEIGRVEGKVDDLAAATTTRIEQVEKRLVADDAKQSGRAQTFRVFIGTVTWFFEHGWKLVVSIWALIWGWTALTTGRLPMSNEVPTPPSTARVYQPEQGVVLPSASVTNQQPAQDQGGQDWPLRTFSDQ